MPHSLLRIGLTGLLIVAVLNLLAALILDQTAANPIHATWWSVWFPAYACWLGMLLVLAVFKLIRVLKNRH
jgi:hypothetical protein